MGTLYSVENTCQVTQTSYSINMKFLLYMMIVALSNAGRIPRSFDTYTHDHHNFPNLQTVHHGHGATSYQNVQIQSHGKIPISTKPDTIHHYVYPEDDDHVSPHLSDDDIQNHSLLSDDSEPYTSNNIEHIEINNIAEPSSYYQYDQEYDYGYY